MIDIVWSDKHLGPFFKVRVSRELEEMILFPGEIWINYIVSYLYCLQFQAEESCHLKNILTYWMNPHY